MEQFTRISGIAAPLLRINIDTDQIIPSSEMIRGTDGSYDFWGEGLFGEWRYLSDRSPNPAFILNRAPYDKAVILLAGRNFGCGSSREPAPKAIRGFGLRSVIAPSFSGIFFNNCFRNGVLPVEQPMDVVAALARQVEDAEGHTEIAVDLERQEVTAPDGATYGFRTPELFREMLLSGQDEIDLTLSRHEEIETFRATDRIHRPWAYL
jgi:3-isopropylmalate/(R)-2-methylmalate dehydratase small subunit